MARSILGIKKFPGLSKYPESPPVTKFGLTRKSPRCAQCLKFKAEDPSKIGEDEFGKLLRCSNCKKVNYCSKICAEKNWPFHIFYCANLKQAHLSPPSMIYATAVMGEDPILCEEFLDFAKNLDNASKRVSAFGVYKLTQYKKDQALKLPYLQPGINALCNVMLLFLGRDQEAYEFLKYSISNFEKEANYELFLKSKPTNHGSCKEKFFAMDFFKRLLITTTKSTQSPSNCPNLRNSVGFDEQLLVPYWLILVIIKINVIEEMKHNFNKMQAYFQKWDRKKFKKTENKFKNSPMILEGLAILHLGNDDTIGCSKGM